MRKKTVQKRTFILFYLVVLAVCLGCRRDSSAPQTIGSETIFENLSSNELRKVVWNDAQGKLLITNQTTIKELTSVMGVIKGVPTDNRRKRLAVGDLRYNAGLVTNSISFYTEGVVDINGKTFLIDFRLADKIQNIIHPAECE